MSLISFDMEKCTTCGICSMICPLNIIMPGEEGNPSLPVEYESFCSRCGHCEAICPSSAITVNYQVFPPEDDIADIGQINSGMLTKYVQSRRSIRAFKNKPVEKEKITSIFEAVRFAPSGMNAQPVKWLVVTDSAKIKKFANLTIDWMRIMDEKGSDHPLRPIFSTLIALADAGFDPICRDAPSLVYAYTENAIVGHIDSIIALTIFDLMAPSFGLGACWAGLLHIAAVEYQPLKEAIGIPDCILQYPILFGYPKYKYRKIPGKNKANIIWR